MMLYKNSSFKTIIIVVINFVWLKHFPENPKWKSPPINPEKVSSELQMYTCVYFVNPKWKSPPINPEKVSSELKMYTCVYFVRFEAKIEIQSEIFSLSFRLRI